MNTIWKYFKKNSLFFSGAITLSLTLHLLLLISGDRNTQRLQAPQSRPMRYRIHYKTETPVLENSPQKNPPQKNPATNPVKREIKTSEESSGTLNQTMPQEKKLPGFLKTSEEVAEAEVFQNEGNKTSGLPRMELGQALGSGRDTASLPLPSYPEKARTGGYEGTVILDIIIGVHGEIIKTELIKSSGFPLLDRAAEETVNEEWIFPPQNESIITRKEFRFELK